MSESDNKFQLTLDVTDYSPEEINVNIEDSVLVITGEHEEWLENEGYVTRHFIRRVLVPGNVRLDAIDTNISSGILTVTASASMVSGPQSGNIEQVAFNESREVESRQEDKSNLKSGNTERKKHVTTDEPRGQLSAGSKDANAKEDHKGAEHKEEDIRAEKDADSKARVEGKGHYKTTDDEDDKEEQ